MTERDQAWGDGQSRPKMNPHPHASTRPREAPRPDRLSRSSGPAIRLAAPSVVKIPSGEERRAVGAVGELLVPVVFQPSRQYRQSKHLWGMLDPVNRANP